MNTFFIIFSGIVCAALSAFIFFLFSTIPENEKYDCIKIYKRPKGRKFKKLRKKALSPGYYSERREKFASKCQYWDHFHRFECNSFFVGEEKAQYNFEQYFKYYPRAKAKYNWYTKKEKEYELRETL